MTEPEVIERAGRRRTLVAAGAILLVFATGAVGVAAVNSGGDGDGEQAVDIAPEPQPSSTPSAAALSPAGDYLPRDVELSRQKGNLRVTWTMRALPEDVVRWRVIAYESNNPDNQVVEFTSGAGARPAPGEGKIVIFDFTRRVPIGHCVRVDTMLGASRFVSSPLECPRPAQRDPQKENDSPDADNGDTKPAQGSKPRKA